MDDGREVCLANAQGRVEYERRRGEMWARQKGLCALEKCGQRMALSDTRFTHGEWREAGQLRDDRVEDGEGRRVNWLVHKGCLRAWHGGGQQASRTSAPLLAFASAVLALTFAAQQARAQGAPISTQVITPYSTLAPSVPVRLCPISSTGTPCNSTGTTIYSNEALTSPITNPTATDQYGNVSVWVTPGIYQLQVNPSPGVYYTYPVSAAIGGSSVIGGGQQVNVQNAQFAAGCVGVDGNPTGLADPTGTYNSECAARAALAFSASECVIDSNGSSCPNLYFPAGRYLLGVSGYAAVLQEPSWTCIVGDSPTASVLVNTSATATLIGVQPGTKGCVEHLGLEGSGLASTGPLLENIDNYSGWYEDLRLFNSAGKGINNQGSAERNTYKDIKVDGLMQCVDNEGNANETYYVNVECLFTGQVGGQIFSSNASTGGVLGLGTIANGAVTRPDALVAVWLDGENVHWIGGSSIKGNDFSALRLGAEGSDVEHTYSEQNYGTPYSVVSHSFEQGGKLIYCQPNGNFGAGALSFPCDTARFQPLYYNDPATAKTHTAVSYTSEYRVYPRDYSDTSTAASTSIPGMSQDQWENINVGGCSGDGNCYILGQSTSNLAVGGTVTAGSGVRGAVTTHQNWTANNYVVTQIPAVAYGFNRIVANHINGVHVNGYTNACQDGGLQSVPWYANRSNTCADILADYQPDGYAIPSIASGYKVTGNGSVSLDHNVIFFGTYSAPISTIQVASNVVTVVTSDSLLYTKMSTLDQVSFPYGLTASFLNGQQAPVTGVSGATFTISFLNANYGPTVETGASVGWNGEIFGQGAVKCATACIVDIAQGNSPLRTFTPGANLFNLYHNGLSFIYLLGGANGVIDDPSASYHMDAGQGLFNALIERSGQPPAQQINEAQCTVGGVPTNYSGPGMQSQTGMIRSCINTNGTTVIQGPDGAGGWVNLGSYGITQTIGTNGATMNPIASTVQIFNGTGSTIDVNFDACTTANAGETHDITQQATGTAQTYLDAIEGGGSLQINGTFTGCASSAANLARGVHWFALCDNSANGFAEWRVNTNGGPATTATVAMASGVTSSGTVTSPLSNHEMSGVFTANITTAITAGTAAFTMSFANVDNSPVQSCDWKLGTTSLSPIPGSATSGSGCGGNVAFSAYAPTGGIATGTYSGSYQCQR